METNTACAVKENDDLPDLLVEDWDDEAQIPIPHFNFIIQLLLPRHLVSKIPEREQNVVQNINTKQYATYGDKPNIKCVAVGSSAEAYMLPSILHKVPGVQVYLYSDMDVLLEWQLSPLQELFGKCQIPSSRMSYDWTETHPGYARINVNYDRFGNTDPAFFVKSGDKYYLSAKKQREDRFHDLESEVLADKSNYTVDSKGPAIAVEDSSKLTANFIRSLEKLQIRQELVTAIPCCWLSNAENWKTRPRKNKWLSPELIGTVVKEGCHLVPVAHKHSGSPDIEWRISFASTEVKLAKEIVTAEQRQCYIYLKLLRQIMMKDKSLISSYHCKTVFLYSCETLPLETWEDNPSLCLLYMLDRLLYHVRRRFLPSFFIPENNLIDHFTDEEYEVCEAILTGARKNPVGQILEFTDTHVIGNQTVSESFRELIVHVVDDIKNYKMHRNVKTSMDSFINAFLKVIYANVSENKILDAVSYSLDSSKFFMKYFPGDDIKYYLFCVFANVNLTMQLVNIFETILSFAEEYPLVLGLRGYLATLYHCASFSFKSDSQRYEETIAKSGSLFSTFLEENDNEDQVAIDYAHFLLNVGNTKLAINVLRKLITSDRTLKSSNSFSVVTCITLDRNLRNEIQNLFKKSVTIQIPSIALAHYTYLKCLQKEGNTTDGEQGIVEFENTCKVSGNSWSYFLFGSYLMEIEKYEHAETTFLTALKIPPKSQINLQTKVHVCHIQQLLFTRKAKEAIEYLVEVRRKFYNHVPLVGYLNYIALNLTKLCFTVNLFEEMMKMADEYPEMNESRGNMACMYHAYAFEFPDDSDEFLTASAQAYTLFDTHVKEGGGDKLSSKIDYAMFLSSQGQWEGIMDLLGSPLCFDLSCTDSNSYSLLEIKRLDENLQREICIHGQFDAPAIAFAFYLCIKCSLKLEKTSTELNTIVECFQSYCENVKHARAYALLGYTYMMVDRYTDAELSFCKAVIYCRTYCVAKQNVNFCRTRAEEFGQSKLDFRGLNVPFCLIPELEGNFNLDFGSMFL